MKDLTEKDKKQLVKLIDEDTTRLERMYIDALTDEAIKSDAKKHYYNARFSKDVYKALERNFKAEFDLQNVVEINNITQKMNRRQIIADNNIWVIVGIGLMFAIGTISFTISVGFTGLLLKPLSAAGLSANVISAIQLALLIVVFLTVAGVSIWYFLKSIDYWESYSKAWNALDKRRKQYAKHHAEDLISDFINDNKKDLFSMFDETDEFP